MVSARDEIPASVRIEVLSRLTYARSVRASFLRYIGQLRTSTWRNWSSPICNKQPSAKSIRQESMISVPLLSHIKRWSNSFSVRKFSRQIGESCLHRPCKDRSMEPRSCYVDSQPATVALLDQPPFRTRHDWYGSFTRHGYIVKVSKECTIALFLLKSKVLLLIELIYALSTSVPIFWYNGSKP